MFILILPNYFISANICVVVDDVDLMEEDEDERVNLDLGLEEDDNDTVDLDVDDDDTVDLDVDDDDNDTVDDDDTVEFEIYGSSQEDEFSEPENIDLASSSDDDSSVCI